MVNAGSRAVDPALDRSDRVSAQAREDNDVKPVEITVTCVSAEECDTIAHAVVSDRLSACAQSWPIRSTYRWKGEIATDTEHLLVLKSVEHHFTAVCHIIRSLHSYDLPAIVMVPLLDTGPGYREWLAESTT
jgi:periplasmic divalent cation tolerance protein